MNTAQLKKFAAEARTILKEGVIMRLEALGFKPDGSVDDEDKPVKGQGYILYRGEALTDDGFYERWMSLYNRVQQKGIQEVYEEAAYTWFNRLMAIRIMAKNDFISPVLEYASETTHIPVILAQAQQGQLPEMTESERKQLRAIIDDGRKTQEQFAILITAYCHDNPIINKCFGGVTDYTMMLLPQNIIAAGGFIDLLNNTSFITKEDYQSAELIGWLYQFYISEKKDDVFASFKAGKKAEAEDIPAATQIFTPSWIVKYMVQNTLGRIYLDNNPYADEIREKMKYLVEPSEPTPDEAIFRYERLEDLRLGDLACGSGHILNEFFDLLYELYIADMASRREAIESIFKYNLIGIDLDTRAKQLAQFALLVKACQKDASFLDAAVMPQVLDMPEPIDTQVVKQVLPQFFLGGNELMIQETEECFKLLQQAHNLGSIMKFNISDRTRAAIEIRLQEWEAQEQETVPQAIKDLYHSFHLILALTLKYSALCMNPPYMGSGNMNDNLSVYVKKNYADGKADLMTVFMLKAENSMMEKGCWGMINLPSWMFLPSFKDLRAELVHEYQIKSLLHNGRGIFGSDFGSVAFVVVNDKPYCKGIYRRLFEKHVQVRTVETIHQLFLDKSYNYYEANQKDFERIAGCPLGYWLSESALNSFSGLSMGDITKSAEGIKTGKNELFIRFWYEVKGKDISLCSPIYVNKKWDLVHKGGEKRKWYGNITNVVFWKNNGETIRNRDNSGIQGTFTFSENGFTWSDITSGGMSFRLKPKNHKIDSKGPTGVCNNESDLYYILGLLNSVVTQYFSNLLNPTISFKVGNMRNLPFVRNKDKFAYLENISKKCVDISKEDWNTHETSWDFKTNELLTINENDFHDIIKL